MEQTCKVIHQILMEIGGSQDGEGDAAVDQLLLIQIVLVGELEVFLVGSSPHGREVDNVGERGSFLGGLEEIRHQHVTCGADEGRVDEVHGADTLQG